ncbi:MAG: hypothetical protein R3B55_01310 [Candidatus Paceibacterota bacterium]
MTFKDRKKGETLSESEIFQRTTYIQGVEVLKEYRRKDLDGKDFYSRSKTRGREGCLAYGLTFNVTKITQTIGGNEEVVMYKTKDGLSFFLSSRFVESIQES